MKKIAILGAGLSGLTLAHSLQGKFDVTLFDKGRGPGGRMATRRHEGFQFDHGAQFLTARDPEFKEFLAPYLKSGLLQEWQPRILNLDARQKPFKRDWFEPHYVAVPTMTALVKQMASSVPWTRARIQSLNREFERWIPIDSDGKAYGPFDWVVSTCPAHQTEKLLDENFVDRPALGRVEMQPCFVLMLGFTEAPETRWEAANCSNSPLGWLAWNHRKPGREARPALVALADNAWAEEHLEDPLERIQSELGRALQDLTGIDLSQAAAIQIHRWRYASTKTPAGRSYLFDPLMRLAACGDWCIANRVEAAFTSARALGRRLTNSIV